MATKTQVHSYYVNYEENAEDGLRYLRDDLDSNECKVFFDQARQKGSVQFEDDDDRQFTLFYRDSAYTLVRR